MPTRLQGATKTAQLGRQLLFGGAGSFAFTGGILRRRFAEEAKQQDTSHNGADSGDHAAEDCIRREMKGCDKADDTRPGQNGCSKAP